MISEHNNASHLNPEIAPTFGVMRLSAIGDVTNALAAVTNIKAFFPEAKIIWFIGKIEHQLLKDIPGIEFEVIDKKNSFNEYLRIKDKYKTTHFDALLHMQRSLRCSFILNALKAKKIIGFDSPRAKELQWFFTNEKINTPKSPHAVDVFMEFAYKLGVPRDETPKWDFGSFSSINEIKKITGNDSKYISIVVSGSQEDRAWKAKNNATLIQWILENTDYKIYLLGGPSAFEKNQAFQTLKELGTHKKIVDLVGKTDLKMLKTIIKNSSALISPDTGPIHISSALGVPTIGLYVHMPKEITGPYNSLKTTIDKYPEALKKYHNQTTPYNYDGIPKRIKGYIEAINLIEPSEVIKTLSECLKRSEN